VTTGGSVARANASLDWFGERAGNPTSMMPAMQPQGPFRQVLNKIDAHVFAMPCFWLE
jgi:hypothetical protein